MGNFFKRVNCHWKNLTFYLRDTIYARHSHFCFAWRKICMTHSQQHAKDPEAMHNTEAGAGCWLGDSRWFCEMVMLFGGAAPVCSFGTTSSASLCPRPQLLGNRNAFALGYRAALCVVWVYFLQFQLLQQWSPVAWENSCAPVRLAPSLMTAALWELWGNTRPLQKISKNPFFV